MIIMITIVIIDVVTSSKVEMKMSSEITSIERDRLADLVISKTMTSKEVSDKYNISSNNIRLFTNKRRSKGMNHDRRGRYSIIDGKSNEAIKDRYENSSLVFNSISDFEHDLKTYIRIEAALSNERRTSVANCKAKYNNNVKSKDISKRTLNRLLVNYKSKLFDFVNINSKG